MTIHQPEHVPVDAEHVLSSSVIVLKLLEHIPVYGEHVLSSSVIVLKF